MSEKIADELHAFIAAAPHKYPGHLIELFDRAEKALRRCSAESEDDPTASPVWNDGCDFAMTQLCIFLGVDQSDVRWDAATETVDGDVQAVIGNILRAKFGEDWGPSTEPQTAPIGYVSQATLRLLSERGQAGHICPVPAYDTLIPVYAGPVQRCQAVNVERCTTCGRTDAEYAKCNWTCTNPWHADAHLRKKAATLTRPQRDPAACPSCGGTDSHTSGCAK